MSNLHHQLIAASAGSGKTFQLVRRYLHLLTLGVNPETVVAMTFTRKAAGEFFNRILNQLADLALGKADPKDYFKSVVPSVPEGVDFATMLQQLVHRMHRLRLGTLDSFFSSVTACFPLELGLPSGASVMDADEAKQRRETVLDELLDELQCSHDAELRHALLEGVKQASFGDEPKSFEYALGKWIDAGHDLWIASGGTEVWGGLQAIWPERPDAAREVTQEEMQAAMAAFEKVAPDFDKAQDYLDEWKTDFLAYQPGQKLTNRVSYFLKKTGDHLDELLRGNAELKVKKRSIHFDEHACQAWLRMIELLVKQEVNLRAHRTRGVGLFLKKFEETYDTAVRANGHLSFADVPRLLLAGADDEGWSRDDLWFRLDGKFDHWMIDEFQDTSFSQWKVLHPLVDEVLQDDSGRRSFFAVGDLKQSIYLWRQAEPGLFREVLEQYPANGNSGVHLGSLATSFRSAQAVLNVINLLFSDRAAIATLLPGSEKDWVFEEHTAHHQDRPGYVQILSTPERKKGNKASREDDTDDESETVEFEPQHRLAAKLVKQLEPIQRGLSCAVLVRSNQDATAAAEAVRAIAQMPVICESEVEPVIDNALTLTFLSLLKWAVHPQDRLAWQHLQMTPLRTLVTERSDPEVPWTTAAVRTLVFEKGFAATAEAWIKAARPLMLNLDSHHEKRIGQLLDLASQFDQTGSRDIDQFIEHAKRFRLRQTGSTSAIQVMTVHRSKGLEFDIVILPELQETMDKTQFDPWMVDRDRDQVHWVLHPPTAPFLPLDPVLREHREQAKATAGFESLCRLYVAMTRAKQALFMIAGYPTDKGEAMRQDTFIRSRLGLPNLRKSNATLSELDGEFFYLEMEQGDPNWASTPTPELAPPAAEEPHPLQRGELATRLRAVQPRQRRRTPSGEESFKVPGKLLFGKKRDVGRHLGTRVHELLAEVDWWPTDGEFDILQQRWAERGLVRAEDELGRLALDLVLPVLKDPACVAALSRPVEPALSWRERSFDLVVEGDWISGIIDRVQIGCDAGGRPMEARIIDFKTDHLTDDVALEQKINGYRPQLDLYRTAVCGLTGLCQEKVTAALLFVRDCRLVSVL